MSQGFMKAQERTIGGKKNTMCFEWLSQWQVMSLPILYMTGP